MNLGSSVHPGVRKRIWWRLGPVGVWLFLAAAAVWVLAFNPTDRIADPTGPCLWHALTGINGPTCGGTRMFWYLLHGNLIQAARHHLAAVIGMLYGLYALTAWTLAVFGGRRLPVWKPGPRAAAVYIGLFLLYAVVHGGIRAETTSADSRLAELLRSHVAAMRSRLVENRPIRQGDPLFREIFKHHGDIAIVAEEIPDGVRVTETSADPQVVLLIRQHARAAVSQFVSQGMSRAMQPTPLPEGYRP